MADNKRGREEQARDEDRRQRQRDVAASLERMDEPEPPVAPEDIEAVAVDLERVDFPATSAEIVADLGDLEVRATGERFALADLLPETDAETFEAPDAVRDRVERPTVAIAMKRLVEAGDDVQHATLSGSQRDAYEKTFRALRAIDAVDEDEGIPVIADWIVERLEETDSYPGSRAVRRQAAKYCRGEGYEVRSDEWLGV